VYLNTEWSIQMNHIYSHTGRTQISVAMMHLFNFPCSARIIFLLTCGSLSSFIIYTYFFTYIICDVATLPLQAVLVALGPPPPPSVLVLDSTPFFTIPCKHVWKKITGYDAMQSGRCLLKIQRNLHTPCLHLEHRSLN
jgi:hypothetical protein